MFGELINQHFVRGSFNKNRHIISRTNNDEHGAAQENIQNRSVHISLLNGALWDMEQAYCGICEITPLYEICFA